jgi:hypothetical protein
VLEINSQLPSDVKALFEDSSFERMAENMQKIASFQENQVRIYQEASKKYAKMYSENKLSIEKCQNLKQKIKEHTLMERQIQTRLKKAYK